MSYVHKKARCGPEIATFRTKTLHFFRVIRLNWLAKIELRGPGALIFNIVVSYCCKQKMLKRNWNWKNNRCFRWNFIWGSLGPPPPPLATPRLQVRKTKKVFEILSVQKLVLSVSRGPGNFRVLEASRPRPRTSKSVLEDVLEAKDVREDSTSGHYSKQSKS